MAPLAPAASTSAPDALACPSCSLPGRSVPMVVLAFLTDPEVAPSVRGPPDHCRRVCSLGDVAPDQEVVLNYTVRQQ